MNRRIKQHNNRVKQNSFRYLIFSCCLFIACAPPCTVAEPSKLAIPAFESIYKIKKSGITIGETKRTLTLNANGPNLFESITRPAGLGRLLTSGQVVERSEWLFNHGNLIPQRYTYFDSSGDNDRNVQISFNWHTGTITNTVNGEPWKMKLVENAQDKLLYQIQLMQDLATGVSTTLDYPVADGGTLKEYHLENFGNEMIKTDFGKFDTIRIRRIHGKRRTTFWCAKQLYYLPVRIEQRYKNNSPITATLITLNGM